MLAAFRAHAGRRAAWFVVLALSAALFAPIAIGVGRLSRRRAMRSPCRSASRPRPCRSSACCAGRCWCPASPPTPQQRPGRRRAARDFGTAHRVLGNLIGETLGYLLTAAWTLLVLVALGRALAGRWFTVLGAVSAGAHPRRRAVAARPAGRRPRQLRRLRPVERLAGGLRRRCCCAGHWARAPRPRGIPCPAQLNRAGERFARLRRAGLSSGAQGVLSVRHERKPCDRFTLNAHEPAGPPDPAGGRSASCWPSS